MPNWCDNQVTITGPNSVIDEIEKIVKEDDSHENNGLLNFFHPMPKELEGTTSPSSSADKPQPMVEGFDCWYDAMILPLFCIIPILALVAIILPPLC